MKQNAYLCRFGVGDLGLVYPVLGLLVVSIVYNHVRMSKAVKCIFSHTNLLGRVHGRFKVLQKRASFDALSVDRNFK